jgi:hypothetical protein
VQYSDESQVPFDSLQRVVDGARSSAGQSGDAPVSFVTKSMINGEQKMLQYLYNFQKNHRWN